MVHLINQKVYKQETKGITLCIITVNIILTQATVIKVKGDYIKKEMNVTIET